MSNFLEPPDKFEFPFEPYSIQHDFMTSLYKVLEGGKLGIFESPTGTGKSISMICGALTWLEDHEKRIRASLCSPDTNTFYSDFEENGDWITQQARQREERQKNAERQQKLRLLDEKEKELANIIQRVLARRKSVSREKMKEVKMFYTNLTKNDVSETKSEDDLLLEEYSENLEKEEDEEENKEAEDEHVVTKVFFCSRTHSQLSQLASELQRSIHVNKRTVCLASRQSYCINPSVRSLGNITLINEKCLEHQLGRSTTKRDGDGCATKRAKQCSSHCPYKVQEPVSELHEEILAEIHDVEDLVKKGREMKACPYYATRAAVRDAQVVLLPYNTLLHESTREASGISLKGNVVIIDEAHNLLDTIAQMHSAQVTGQQLADTCTQLNRYRLRYEKRFSAMNLLRLDQMIFYVGRLLRVLRQGPNGGKGSGTVLYHLEEFMSAAEVDNINPHVLLEFCRKSRLAHKLRGFADKYPPEVVLDESRPAKGLSSFLKEINGGSTQLRVEVPEAQPETPNEPRSRSPILSVLGFLECLTSRSRDGRVVCSRLSTLGPSHLKFLLLNPAEHFRAVVQEARAVVVAGGTMQPLTEFREQLFLAAGAAADRVTWFSCGHVVPPDNILPITLGKGPTGKQLNFSYESRSSPQMIQEVERLLSNVCNIVPGGIVCFFPSYEYEQQVFHYLQRSGALERLQTKKKVFREPKRAQVEQVLRDYASAVKAAKSLKAKTGALMLSVVGGKLSEGLNFSDDLGRLVIVVGMPYPNSRSAELQEKMTYLNSHVESGSGRKYYEALCMKAVNQSIGRAIRHRGDYATVILADYRYSRPAAVGALPGWMRKSIQCCDTFGACLFQIRQFFKKREESC